MAGTIIADKIQTENAFLTLNVGQTLVATINSSGILNSSGGTMIGANGSVSNTAITGLVTASQIATVANTQLTGNITSSQIAPSVTLTTPIISGNLNLDATGTSGIRLPAANTITFHTAGTEDVRIDATGNVGIGTSSPTEKLTVSGAVIATSIATSIARDGTIVDYESGVASRFIAGRAGGNYGSWRAYVAGVSGVTLRQAMEYEGSCRWYGEDGSSERMRIDTNGNLFVGRTSDTDAAGITVAGDGLLRANRNGGIAIIANRNTNDGTIIDLRQEGFTEGTITVSGTTVSYNGGHLARWSQLPDNSKDDTILKGTVLTNLNDMCVWTKDDEILPNEQLNKMKVSDVDGDTNVAGVFVNWTRDEDCNSDDMNVAMTGDMIIRIAQGVTVQRGDLLMSAGDGTAKPQEDDIRRSKTIAKVTSTHVTCTYEDGSYCVPCVLMAC